MNKKGASMLAKTIIGIIIGIACLFLLFGLLNAAAGLLFGSNEDKQAKAEIDKLVQTLESIEKSNEAVFCPVFSPFGWHIISYSKKDIEAPKECFGFNCVCVCPESSFLSTGLFAKPKCEKGFCKIISKELVFESKQVSEKIPIDLWIKLNDKYIIETKRERDKKYAPYNPSDIWLDKFLSEKYPAMKGLGQCIVENSQKTQIPVAVILAVAVHESSGGTSGLAKGKSNYDGTYAYNLFGYKSTKESQGTAGTSKWKTSECLSSTGSDVLGSCKEAGCTVNNCGVGATCYCVVAGFKAFYNQCESIKAFTELITSERYKKAMEQKDNIENMITYIHGAGYATDPEWAASIKTIALSIQNEINEKYA